MSMKDLLDLTQEIREEVSRYSGHPYSIAGGCLRDAFFERPINDIDLIVACSQQWTHLTEWPNTFHYGPTGDFMAGDTEISVNGYPVQLVMRDGQIDAPSLFRYHSLAVSNFFYSDGLIQIDPQALRDYQDKLHTMNTLRWCSPVHDPARLAAYIEKIQKKYPWEIREERYDEASSF